MRKTKEEAQKTRTALLDAALRSFHRKGYAATTLNDIAVEAGLTRGAIYWHFKNKREIFETLLEGFYDELDQIIQSALEQELSPIESIGWAMRNILLHVAANQRLRTIEELLLFKTEINSETAYLADEYQQRALQIKELISAYIIEGVEAGEIRNDIDPDTCAAAIISFLSGIKLTWLFSSEILDLNRSAEKLVDTFINGLRA